MIQISSLPIMKNVDTSFITLDFKLALLKVLFHFITTYVVNRYTLCNIQPYKKLIILSILYLATTHFVIITKILYIIHA